MLVEVVAASGDADTLGDIMAVSTQLNEGGFRNGAGCILVHVKRQRRK
jgi:hypothetical protein